MQKCHKLLLTLNLIVALPQSQTRTKCIKITEGFSVAHSSLCFKCNLQARLGQNWLLFGFLFHTFVFRFGHLEHTRVLEMLHKEGQGRPSWTKLYPWDVLQMSYTDPNCEVTLGDKESKRKREWDSENSPQQPAREKNNLPFDGFCL